MPEIILPIVFLVSLILIKIVRKDYQFALAGRISMAAMLVTTGIAHFAFAKGMSLMLPDFIPGREIVVYLTGVLEILFAVGLLLNRYAKLTGWLLIVFFALILPANIYAAIKHVDMENATFEGEGPDYLLYRIPLQVFFIGWTYLSCSKVLHPASRRRR